MSTLDAITNLTQQTTDLLEVFLQQVDVVDQKIEDAVIVSENAAIVPLLTVATNLLNTQALLVTFIAR